MLLAGLQALPATADNIPQTNQHFTVIVSSAFARSQPDGVSQRLFSVFSGETYTVLAVSADGTYVQVGGWNSAAGWLPTEYGLHTTGRPATSEQVAAALASRTALVPALPSGVISEVSPEALAVYQHGQTLGNQPHVFAKIGDCNSENGRFLVMFTDAERYALGEQYAYLQATIDYYAGSWDRTSVAAQSGFSPAAVMDPVFADPAVCEAGESPMLCEYRIMNPSVALIALGTHYAPTMAQYEADLRIVIEQSMRAGVVPILATKADDVEGGDRINSIIRRLAAEYRMPLWDYWLAVQPLPNGGLQSDGIHPSYARPAFDDPWSMRRGWPWRNLTALLALESVRAATTGGQGLPGTRLR